MEHAQPQQQPAGKLHGRAFYESLGSPKHVIAPMVDQSEFAWRILTRSFLPPDLRRSILAYSPMLHAKLFAESPKYRPNHFEPLRPPLALSAPGELGDTSGNMRPDRDLYLDGNPQIGDRPLFVQFCANDPDLLLEAAKIVQPYCDAVDLNLGCPQGIAKKGNYGAFLQEHWSLIHRMINKLHCQLDIPVTAKMRVLDTKERTLEYAQMILDAGASIITVHGRQREQKGHNTGLADWSVLRYLRDRLPPETVMFANGNILQHADLQQCLDETGADGVMSAEGNLHDPSIFAPPPPVREGEREYWRGRDGKGGYRMDAVLRRYLDIVYKHVLGKEPPSRDALFLPSDIQSAQLTTESAPSSAPSAKRTEVADTDSQPLRKRQKVDNAAVNAVETLGDARLPQKETKNKQTRQEKKGKIEKCSNSNLVAMQAHCFRMLRPLVSQHHNVRDALARCRAGDIDAFENVLRLTEAAVKEGLLAYELDPSEFEDTAAKEEGGEEKSAYESSVAAVRRCKRPYWICQPYVRPLPSEALEKGAMQLSKQTIKKMAAEREATGQSPATAHQTSIAADHASGLESNPKARLAESEMAREQADRENMLRAGLQPEGRLEATDAEVLEEVHVDEGTMSGEATKNQPRAGMVCG